jgi:hypothetical protein
MVSVLFDEMAIHIRVGRTAIPSNAIDSANQPLVKEQVFDDRNLKSVDVNGWLLPRR